MTNARSIRVFLFDDHEVVLQGISAILRGSNISVVGTAPSGEQGLEDCRTLQPDIVLLDVRLQGGEDGISLIKPLQDICLKCRVIVFTAFDSPTAIARAAAAGATDFILKTIKQKTPYVLLSRVLRLIRHLVPTVQLKKLTARLSKRRLPLRHQRSINTT